MPAFEAARVLANFLSVFSLIVAASTRIATGSKAHIDVGILTIISIIAGPDHQQNCVNRSFIDEVVAILNARLKSRTVTGM